MYLLDCTMKPTSKRSRAIDSGESSAAPQKKRPKPNGKEDAENGSNGFN